MVQYHAYALVFLLRYNTIATCMKTDLRHDFFVHYHYVVRVKNWCQLEWIIRGE